MNELDFNNDLINGIFDKALETCENDVFALYVALMAGAARAAAIAGRSREELVADMGSVYAAEYEG